MAIIDVAFKEWLADFKTNYPALFAGRSADTIVDALTLAYKAGAARQPVGLIAQKVGDYRVTVAEDAITVSHGRDIVFAYSAGDAEPINAQPSPGGQGGVRAQFEAWAESAGWYAVAYRPDREAPYALNAVEFAWQAFQAALAARQSVDPERGHIDPSWSLHDRVEFALRDAGFDLDEAAFVAEAADRARQPVGEPAMYQVRPRSFDDGEGWREVTKREYDDRGPFPGYDEAEWERRTLYAAPPEGYVTREDMLAAQDRAFYDGLSKAEPAIPEGYVLVPVEMTDDMVKAAYPLHYFTYLGNELRERWVKILAARPKVP